MRTEILTALESTKPTAVPFTMLCRVARDGLHDKWTPVKLADLFSEVAPGFVDQINAIRSPTAADATDGQLQASNIAIADALVSYKNAVVSPDTTWTDDDARAFMVIVLEASLGPTGATAQREAFDRVRDFALARPGGVALSPDDDLKARQDARAAASLTLFGTSSYSAGTTTLGAPVPDEEVAVRERILDTEVIAIYW